MRMTFVLPGYFRHPSGGHKVVYEYASRLQARGHDVTIVHPYHTEPQRTPMGWFWARRWVARTKAEDGQLAGWFRHHPGVRLELVPDLRPRWIPIGDVIFATGWQTAPWVARYLASQGQKYYLIQHYETWAGPAPAVEATWRLPLHKVVIAHWLHEIAVEFGEGEHTTYIPNGVDFERFRLIEPIDRRPPARIVMLHHPLAWKGASTGIAALERVRALRPDIDVVFFGTAARSDRIPEWVTYVRNPSQTELERLYNSAAIFLHSSWTEGWPLPPAEAMACGCAVVAAANRGVADYTDHGRTALLVPIKDDEALANGLLALLDDDIWRQQIALAGHQAILAFTWERAVERLEGLMMHESRVQLAG